MPCKGFLYPVRAPKSVLPGVVHAPGVEPGISSMSSWRRTVWPGVPVVRKSGARSRTRTDRFPLTRRVHRHLCVSGEIRRADWTRTREVNGDGSVTPSPTPRPTREVRPSRCYSSTSPAPSRRKGSGQSGSNRRQAGWKPTTLPLSYARKNESKETSGGRIPETRGVLALDAHLAR